MPIDNATYANTLPLPAPMPLGPSSNSLHHRLSQRRLRLVGILGLIFALIVVVAGILTRLHQEARLKPGRRRS